MNRLLPLVGLLACACGDPLVDGDYLGEPLFRVSGTIEGDAGTSSIRRPWLGVLWVNPLDYQLAVVATTAPIRDPRFPGQFTIDFFDEPAPALHAPLPGADVAFGVAVVFDDVDGDGKLVLDPEGIAADEATGELIIDSLRIVRPPDVLFGSATQLIVHVRPGGSLRCQAWTFGDVAPVARGFHIAGTSDCEGGSSFPLEPPGTPLRIRLFSPGQPPEEPEDTEVCVEPSCEARPEQPHCQMLQAQEACEEIRCTEERTALYACLATGCSSDDADCGCSAAIDEYFLCFEERCGFEALCAM